MASRTSGGVLAPLSGIASKDAEATGSAGRGRDVGGDLGDGDWERPLRGLSARHDLLAIEVLSPTTRHLDLHLKRARYEAAGCPSYWVFDPDVPALTVWELDESRYGDPLHVEGDATVRLDHPFPVSVRPADLIL